MATLREIIPQEFFVPQPIKPKTENGSVTICDRHPYVGSIVVAWGKKCPVFNENLAAARSLKVQGCGTYRPEFGGWVFSPSSVLKVLAKFPALVIDPKVVENSREVIETAVVKELTQDTKQLHGSITFDGHGYLVVFGGNYNMPRHIFSDYLDSARQIKAKSHSRGWLSSIKSWCFRREAAAMIVKAFSQERFTYPKELASDAEQHPEQAEAHQEQLDQGADPFADALVNLADAILV